MNIGDLTYFVGGLINDRITEALISIDYAHHEIHGGSSFTANYSRTTAATNGHRTGLYIKTPITLNKYCHLIAAFSCSTAADFSICELPTIAANIGTHGNVIYNRYRDNPKISDCYDNAAVPVINRFTSLTEAQIVADGTFNTGTIIRTAPLRAGAGPNPAGGSTRDTEEYILKSNTAYIFLITNTTASANTHEILIDWYEHTNKLG